ncbi:MAG: transglutaminase domain-containing protein [Phycisphaerales bacterium]|nr:transglutaminase domain-containing protein [Phycisphaerales bacterium]
MLKNSYLIILFWAFSIGGAFAQKDSTIGLKAPKSVRRDYKKLAHFLCDGLQGDAVKVNAIYNWVTHNIKYDVAAMQKGDLKRPTVKQVLKRKKALCDGYSDLFRDLCNEAGIRSLSISGYARDWMFDDSDKFYTPRHAWNVVAIGDRWYPVDATWGAGVIGQFPNKIQRTLKKASKNPFQQAGKLRFKYRYNPKWLMTAPAEFRIKHLPYDPLWQLTDSLMPLSIFEAGEQSIAKFNETYGRPMLDPKEVNRFSDKPEHLRVIEEAERAYSYNPRFHVSMALRHHANAIDSIATLDKNAPAAIRNIVVTQVKKELKTAEKYVALQKKSIVTEYSELKRKNKKKNTEAKTYIRSIDNNNKQAITRCKAKISSSDTKYKNLQQKAVSAIAAHKKIKQQNFQSIKTAVPEDDASSARLLSIVDSIKGRNARLGELQAALKKEQELVDNLETANRNRLDTLVSYLSLADSALIQETVSRINLEDNYDADVKKWSGMYKQARMQQADTTQRHYFAAYDSVLVHYAALRKAHFNYIQLFQKNFKDLEQYKRRNNSNVQLLAQYSQQMDNYTNAYNAQLETMSQHASYIKGNKNLFQQLVKHYEHQGKLANYMKESEEHRQKLEETNLTKKQAFDEKESKYQKKLLEEAVVKAERYINKKEKR